MVEFGSISKSSTAIHRTEPFVPPEVMENVTDELNIEDIPKSDTSGIPSGEIKTLSYLIRKLSWIMGKKYHSIRFSDRRG